MQSLLTFGVVLTSLLLCSCPCCLASQEDTKHYEPVDWNVVFESGKEAAKLYEPSHSLMVKRYLKVRNLAGPELVAKVICEDRFSVFSNDDLKYGDEWEFYIIDLLSHRHFWCSTEFKNDPTHHNYTFRAYGEGAPRANNRIVLLHDGARINGCNVTI